MTKSPHRVVPSGKLYTPPRFHSEIEKVKADNAIINFQNKTIEQMRTLERTTKLEFELETKLIQK